MRESTTYQAILDEGRIEATREDIRRLGERKFSSPQPAHVRKVVEGIGEWERLQTLLERILEVGSWDELLAGTAGQPSGRRKRSK
jgi:hypothetical protein